MPTWAIIVLLPFTVVGAYVGVVLAFIVYMEARDVYDRRRWERAQALAKASKEAA